MKGPPTLPVVEATSPEGRWAAFCRRSEGRLDAIDPTTAGDRLRLVSIDGNAWRSVEVRRVGSRPEIVLNSSSNGASGDGVGRTGPVDDHGWRGVERVLADEELWWTQGKDARGAGPLWVLERVRAHHHHRRWSTEPLGEAFGDACRFLAELGGDASLLRRLDIAASRRLEEVSF